MGTARQPRRPILIPRKGRGLPPPPPHPPCGSSTFPDHGAPNRAPQCRGEGASPLHCAALWGRALTCRPPPARRASMRDISRRADHACEIMHAGVPPPSETVGTIALVTPVTMEPLHLRGGGCVDTILSALASALLPGMPHMSCNPQHAMRAIPHPCPRGHLPTGLR